MADECFDEMKARKGRKRFVEITSKARFILTKARTQEKVEEWREIIYIEIAKFVDSQREELFTRFEQLMRRGYYSSESWTTDFEFVEGMVRPNECICTIRDRINEEAEKMNDKETENYLEEIQEAVQDLERVKILLGNSSNPCNP